MVFRLQAQIGSRRRREAGGLPSTAGSEPAAARVSVATAPGQPQKEIALWSHMKHWRCLPARTPPPGTLRRSPGRKGVDGSEKSPASADTDDRRESSDRALT